ncbi:HNH endonuclease signature motif containing protein [Terribacillus saccharophilus]|uniref:HNH nuclease domain-containing protein n=1 Tax=Terribacillus saccharophilus TaxID=361277 RepID=A0ABX4H0A2_9BACI|nr:HNH endonuclease signature motif containing protein [Terribacillus saccharophilus]PAD35964.1 hypothetical protein CHH56_05935 [Terribacillus saccharophilus]PAD96986.1 hypothetical protein CHH50_06375 [Terribacillus saccharophilus]PAE00562.1 hypothetical protein CHH48_07280 [Terribacillus saccharophilus]
MTNLKRWSNERFEQELVTKTNSKYTRVGEVINNCQPVEVVCNDCGTHLTKRPDNVRLKRSLGCWKCSKIEKAAHTYVSFTNRLKELGYTYTFTSKDLVVDDVTPSRVKVPVINQAGTRVDKSYDNVMRRKGGKPIVWNTERFNAWVIENAPGYKLIGEYEKNTKKTTFLCPDGHVFSMIPKNFKDTGRRCTECSRIANSESRRGEKSHFYNADMTDEERQALAEARRDAKYAQFRRDVLKRDNHECQACKSDEKPEVHHVYSFGAYEELRTNPNNGIVLCRDCHVDFHRKHGYGENTLEQFTEWLQNDNLIETVKNRLEA